MAKKRIRSNSNHNTTKHDISKHVVLRHRHRQGKDTYGEIVGFSATWPKITKVRREEKFPSSFYCMLCALLQKLALTPGHRAFHAMRCRL